MGLDPVTLYHDSALCRREPATLAQFLKMKHVLGLCEVASVAIALKLQAQPPALATIFGHLCVCVCVGAPGLVGRACAGRPLMAYRHGHD